MVDGFNTRLLGGVAGLLQANGIGTFTTAVSDAYPPGSTAIFLGLTPDQPDTAITLMTYPVEDTDLTNVITGLQCRIRGGRDPREVENTSDAMYDLLHNKAEYRVNGLFVILSWRQSGAWMGQDPKQRIERVENFYMHVERAAPHQIP